MQYQQFGKIAFLSGLSLSLLTFTTTNAFAIYESRVFLKEQCPISGPHENGKAKENKIAGTLIAGFGAALLPAVIDTSVGVLKSAIAKAAKNKVITEKGLLVEDGFYILNDGGIKPGVAEHCLILARSYFEEGAFEDAKAGPLWSTLKAQAFAANIKLKRRPAIYFEAYIHVSPDGTKMRLKPMYFDYQVRLDDKSGRVGAANDGGKRDVLLEVIFEEGGSADSKPFAIVLLQFEDLVRPTTKDRLALNELKSKWLNMKPLSKQGLTIFNAYKEKSSLLKSLGGVESDSPVALIEDLKKAKKHLRKEMVPLALLKAQHASELVKLQLDASADTNLDIMKEPLDKAGRKLVRYKRTLERSEKVTAKEMVVAKLQATISGIEAKLSNIENKNTLKKALSEAEKFPVEPYSISINVRETKKVSKFLVNVSKVFSESEAAISTCLKNTLIKSEREQIEQAKLLSRAGKLESELTAVQAQQDVEAKQIALERILPAGDGDAIRAATNDLRLAELRANIAFIKAGLVSPYPAPSVLE